MIELEVQFKLVISSIVFAMVFTNLYTFFDIGLRRSKVLRFIVINSYFVSSTVIYYFLIYTINQGILNVYLPISLIVGYYLHMKFYDKYFSCLYKYLFSKIHSIIDKRKEKCCKIWKELIKKRIKKAKSTE